MITDGGRETQRAIQSLGCTAGSVMIIYHLGSLDSGISKPDVRMKIRLVFYK